MEPSEISLLLLRHLARDGCVETIRTYINECPAVMQSLTGPSGDGLPDVEHFRQKLLNRSVNISLIDLLSEYGRAKSMIQDLVTKLLFEWKALSAYFLSPHDSMATQLAHITKLLESKCKFCPTEMKCVGTSDDPLDLPMPCSVSMVSAPPVLNLAGIDVAVQTAVDEEVEEAEAAVGETNEEASDLPTIVSSLLDPPMIEKIVEIANKEKLNRSNPSENLLANNTDTEIDKMLLDILHGIGGSSLPGNALSTGCNSIDSNVSEQPPVDPQLMDLFQYAHSTIKQTPVPGTLMRPEDSVTKQKPCGSFLDLIDTPFKSQFMSEPSTPMDKAGSEQDAEKPQLKTIELNFGPSTSFAATTIETNPGKFDNRGFLAKQKAGPKYSIVQKVDPRIPLNSQELQRVRKKRNITPKIPNAAVDVEQPLVTLTTEVDTSKVLVRSTSKRKFNTPMKLSPAKAFLNSTVNFYCPSSALDKTASTTKMEKRAESIETPMKHLRTDLASFTQSQDTAADLGNVGIIAQTLKSPLATINYEDLMSSGNTDKNMLLTVQQPLPTAADKFAAPVEVPITRPTPLNKGKFLPQTITTPDFGVVDKSATKDTSGEDQQHVYSRLLTSVRQTRPTSALLNKKSFSTPRKKGHIRSLLFKTPPSAQSERTENSSINFMDDLSLKRKASPSPPLGSKSKKRLRWNTITSEVKEPDISVNEVSIVTTPVQPQPSTSKFSMENIASQIIVQNSVSTRSRSKKPKGLSPPDSSPKKSARQTRARKTSAKKNVESSDVSGEPVPGATIISPPIPTASRRCSKRLDDQKAADAAVIDAIPLGTRNFGHTSKHRVTRGNTRITNDAPPNNQGQEPKSNVWTTKAEIKSTVTATSTVCGDSSKVDVLTTSVDQGNCRTDTGKGDAAIRQGYHAEGGRGDEADKKTEGACSSIVPLPNVSSLHAQNKAPSEGITESCQLKHRTSSKDTQSKNPKTTPSVGIVTQRMTPPISIVVEDSPSTPAVGSSLNYNGVSQPIGSMLREGTAFPNLKAGLAASSALSSPDSALNLTSASTSSKNMSSDTSGNSRRDSCSPSKGRPKSPKKSPGKNPRRILPKPVPPDYPRPVFPPPNQSAGYVLSIPSKSPMSESAGDSSNIFTSFISPVSLVSGTPAKKAQITLSSSDSSSEFNNSVPKTPRVKNDSGEDSTISKLFLNVRGDSVSAGVPIFTSTPMKLGPPETPGKNIGVASAAVNEGDSSTRTSLFDTPIKPESPAKQSNPSLLISMEGIVDKAPRAVEPTPTVSFPTVVPRKSPRKSASPLKIRAKTPRKANTPVKSVQKLPCKTSFEYKPTRRAPYKSPLSKKGAAFLSTSVSPEMETPKNFSENLTPPCAQPASVPEIKSTHPGFPSLCTKSKSFMRLSEIAKRGRAVSSATTPPAAEPKALPPPPSPPRNGIEIPSTSEDKANRGISSKLSDVHFQFAVSGRTKQLSLSEHESLLGLLQIGAAKTQQKSQSRSSQKLEADLFNNLDLNKFLRTVHAGD